MNSKHNPGRESIAATEAWIRELCQRQGITVEQLYRLKGQALAFDEQYDPPGFAERYSDQLARSGADAG